CIWQVHTADSYGKSIWQPYMAGLFGGSNGLICLKIESKKTLQRNEIEKNGIYYGGSVIAISLCSQ
ncbi:MAG: hypothetical protein ACK55Z_23690, partial [bacterium]